MSRTGGSATPGDTQTPAPMIFTKLSGAAIPVGAIVKFGADAAHAVVTAASTDSAIGVALNATGGAEEAIRIATFDGGLTMLASAAITHGAFIEFGAGGKAVTLGAGVGVHQCIGKALSDAAGDGSTFLAEGGQFIREI